MYQCCTVVYVTQWRTLSVFLSPRCYTASIINPVGVKEESFLTNYNIWLLDFVRQAALLPPSFHTQSLCWNPVSFSVVEALAWSGKPWVDTERLKKKKKSKTSDAYGLSSAYNRKLPPPTLPDCQGIHPSCSFHRGSCKNKRGKKIKTQPPIKAQLILWQAFTGMCCWAPRHSDPNITFIALKCHGKQHCYARSVCVCTQF